MEAFWAIVTIVILVRLYWKHSSDSRPRIKEVEQEPVAEQTLPMQITTKAVEESKEEIARKEAERQREKDVAALRKEGYTDELIAVILPTINNGQ